MQNTAGTEMEMSEMHHHWHFSLAAAGQAFGSEEAVLEALHAPRRVLSRDSRHAAPVWQPLAGAGRDAAAAAAAGPPLAESNGLERGLVARYYMCTSHYLI